MDITLPTLPAGMLVLLSLVAPYAVGALNGVLSFVTKPWQRKTVAVIVSLIVAAAVMAFYYVYTGDMLPDWPALTLLAVIVVQASYALITKTTATAVEQRLTPGKTLHHELRD